MVVSNGKRQGCGKTNISAKTNHSQTKRSKIATATRENNQIKSESEKVSKVFSQTVYFETTDLVGQ